MRALLLAIALGILVTGFAQAQSQPVSHRSIVYCEGRTELNCGDVIDMFTVDPGEHYVGLLIPSGAALTRVTRADQLDTMVDYLWKFNGIAAFNGAMTEPFSGASPIGLLRIETLTLWPTNRLMRSSGLACLVDGRLRLTSFEFNFIPDAESCFQTGPMVYESDTASARLRAMSQTSEVLPLNWGRRIQSSVLVSTRSGAMVVLYSDSHSLQEMSDFIQSRAFGDDRAVTAAVLSSGETTGYIVRTETQPLFGGQTRALIPSALTVYFR